LSTVSINSTNFAALTIDYNEDLSDLSDITFSQPSPGAAVQILLPGYLKASGNLSFVYDNDNQPTVSPMLRAGTLVTNYIISPDGTKLYTLSVYVATFSWSGGPGSKGPVMCKVAWQSTGTFTVPAS
jgi:hypothetical protein